MRTRGRASSRSLEDSAETDRSSADGDEEKLHMIARRPKSAQVMSLRARMVLKCGQGMSNSEVARKLRHRRDRR